MRHAVVLLLALSSSGFPATGEVLTPAPGLRSGAAASAPPPTAGQLPPEIMVDRHLVRVDRLLAADDPGAALESMKEILALQEEHDLQLANDFPFRYARVAFAAARTETAIASLNEYLVAAGRARDFYREALQLLDSVRVGLRREEPDRRPAEAQGRRALPWLPAEAFRDCATCPQMVVLPRSGLALGRYEETLEEHRTFAAPTGGSAGAGYLSLTDGGYSWRNPSYSPTDPHPVTCVSWDDAHAYVSWLSRTTGASYRLPTQDELAGPRSVLSSDAIAAVQSVTQPVRSGPTASTPWVFQTCSESFPNGPRAARTQTVGAGGVAEAPRACSKDSSFSIGAPSTPPTFPTTSLDSAPFRCCRRPMPPQKDDRLPDPTSASRWAVACTTKPFDGFHNTTAANPAQRHVVFHLAARLVSRREARKSTT